MAGYYIALWLYVIFRVGFGIYRLLTFKSTDYFISGSILTKLGISIYRVRRHTSNLLF